MNFNMIPKQIYDYEASLARVGQQAHVAKDILKMMIKELPSLQAEIKDALANGDEMHLSDALHKLKGGLAYCVAPNITAIVNQFSTAVHERQKEQYGHYEQQLIQSIDIFLKHIQQEKLQE